MTQLKPSHGFSAGLNRVLLQEKMAKWKAHEHQLKEACQLAVLQPKET